MRRFRVIPVLAVSGRKLVKTVQFRKPKYLGDPINAIKIFNEKEVDELVVIDISASATRKSPDHDHILEMASEAFMPLGYGGGIRSFGDAVAVFNCGVEKIIVNSVLTEGFDIIEQIAATFGNQSVVCSLDVKRNWLGKPQVMTHSGQRKLHLSLDEAMNKLVDAGVGEVIVHSVDRDGTFKGYDLDLVRHCAESLPMPIIALGGADGVSNLNDAIAAGASAVAAGSIFCYKNNNPESILINYPSQSELNERIFKNYE